jgi:hypothetical protein
VKTNILDLPTEDIAVPYDHNIEISNQLVRSTLEKLGPYVHGKEVNI